MLQDIKDKLDALPYFKYSKIVDLDKSCCDSEIEVVDFDRVKDQYCKAKAIQSLGSSDGFYIDVRSSSVIFIEMKSVSSIIEHLDKRNAKKHPDPLVFTKEKIEELESTSASCIVDSILLFFSLLGESGIDSACLSKCLNQNETNIKFFWVIEMTSEQYTTYALSTFASKHKYRILNGGKLHVVQASTFDSLFSGYLSRVA